MSVLPTQTRTWILTRRPTHRTDTGHLRLESRHLPEPGPGQILVRNTHMSVHSAMLGRMLPTPAAQYCGVQGPLNPRSAYTPYTTGEPLTGPAVGEVIASRHASIAEGDLVRHDLAWRQHALLPSTKAEKLPDSGLPPTAYLGALGLNGLTAYGALLSPGGITPGDTVFVSGAAGAVGCLAGQIARIKGAGTLIGSTRSAAKSRTLTDELGFDAAINPTTGGLAEQLHKAAPDGIDLYFDTVGGDHLAVALDHLRPHGRVLLCGMSSQYTQPAVHWPDNLLLVIGKALHITGVHDFNYAVRFPDFTDEMTSWLLSGQITCPTTITTGIEHAYDAVLGLLSGANTGQMLVKL
ncbi:hypothetical protein A6A06_01370 [Streptomyces sp. CB02923]|uniref:NADP-dependent oxidoreductase n=1 Tax=Streptomyces sp. CB02923 TaxID=1718985 RepID=UPI00093A7B48|nr:NADP-dependent oxidoreductase [Streptomyces sp. CB02923]OKI09389.1 hypothetical protein A6A06_01370 [Streptomyces sp. CB02923]